MRAVADMDYVVLETEDGLLNAWRRPPVPLRPFHVALVRFQTHGEAGPMCITDVTVQINQKARFHAL